MESPKQITTIKNEKQPQDFYKLSVYYYDYVSVCLAIGWFSLAALVVLKQDFLVMIGDNGFQVSYIPARLMCVLMFYFIRVIWYYFLSCNKDKIPEKWHHRYCFFMVLVTATWPRIIGLCMNDWDGLYRERIGHFFYEMFDIYNIVTMPESIKNSHGLNIIIVTLCLGGMYESFAHEITFCGIGYSETLPDDTFHPALVRLIFIVVAIWQSGPLNVLQHAKNSGWPVIHYVCFRSWLGVGAFGLSLTGKYVYGIEGRYPGEHYNVASSIAVVSGVNWFPILLFVILVTTMVYKRWGKQFTLFRMCVLVFILELLFVEVLYLEDQQHIFQKKENVEMCTEEQDLETQDALSPHLQ